MSIRLTEFQIDFVASMRVEGVQFHRVQMVNSYSGSNGVLFKFGVEYGSNSSDLQMLSRVLMFVVLFSNVSDMRRDMRNLFLPMQTDQLRSFRDINSTTPELRESESSSL